MANVLITGGAAFIGSNLADRLLSRGSDVTILDNLSRRGCHANLVWLRRRHGEGARAPSARGGRRLSGSSSSS